jgi:DNA replication and repair protein RecF
MYVERLEVSHCRNLSGVALDLSPRLNLLVGPNGAGKTSVLEAVHVLARGRSFRSGRLTNVVQRGQPALLVRARLQDEWRGTVSVAVQRQRSAEWDIRINGEPGQRLSEVAALLPIQLMLPDAAALVFGEPALRRRFLDWGTFHVKQSYLDALRGYQRALRQRNALLRAAQGEPRAVSRELDTWTRALAERGDTVTALREACVARLSALLPTVLDAMAPGLKLSCELSRGWSDDQSLADSLSEMLPRDVKSGMTQTGPHRADLRLSVEGSPAGATLSRGQAKLVTSALNLAQARLTASDSGRASLFLIDDFGAELDREHNLRFFRNLAATGCQVIATATAVPDLGDAFDCHDRRMFHVEHGTVAAA